MKQLCNLSGITSSVAKNTKFYCTNVDNHIGDMFPNGKNNWAHVLEKNSDFVTHPAAPYAIGYEVSISVKTPLKNKSN